MCLQIVLKKCYEVIKPLLLIYSLQNVLKKVYTWHMSSMGQLEHIVREIFSYILPVSDFQRPPVYKVWEN